MSQFWPVDERRRHEVRDSASRGRACGQSAILNRETNRRLRSDLYAIIRRRDVIQVLAFDSSHGGRDRTAPG